MPRKLPDPHLAQTIAWVWLVFVIFGLGAWLAYRFWRKRHPVPPPAPERSYSQLLQGRLAKGKVPAKGTHHNEHTADKQRRGEQNPQIDDT